MAPGNSWHLAVNAEFPENAGMRSPVFPTTATTKVLIFSGNQADGGNQAADQVQENSAVLWKKSTETWAAKRTAPLTWFRNEGNNKYFRAEIDLKVTSDNIVEGTRIQYYLQISYNQNQNLPFRPERTFIRAADGNAFLSDAIVDENMAQARPFSFVVENRNLRGEWGPRFNIGNVGAHASLLRTGQILMWGRRDTPLQSMNTNPAGSLLGRNGPPAAPATCTPWLLNPPYVNTPPVPTPKPLMPGTNVNANLFCSGHTFDPDGNLLVAGGHLEDSNGLSTTHIYEPKDGGVGTWRNSFDMRRGRWYPTVTALPLGTALITEGTYMVPRPNQDPQVLHFNDSQHWSKTAITSLAVNEAAPGDDERGILDLYPRIHVASTGLVYAMSLQTMRVLDMKNFELKPPKSAKWVDLPLRRDEQLRDYGCTVMYETDKVLFVGGGQGPMSKAESIDLSNPATLRWNRVDDMNFRRRQHNATVLPDGTVLVTGGTQGAGEGETVNFGDVKFNDVRPGRPIHVAEIWNPKQPAGQQWTMMASEETDRCYHGTAVLLPDGKVLSAGGGEFQLGPERGNKLGNPERDSHRDAQIFSPPYLFRGPQPVITGSPATPVEHNASFNVSTATPNDIVKISLIGLSSVTHSFNSGQRLIWLDFKVEAGVLKVTAPLNSKICPPAWYMLFILNKAGVPSISKFIQIVSPQQRQQRHARIVAKFESTDFEPPTVLALREAVREDTKGNTRIELGIDPACPYGLSACWGGARETLTRLEGVGRVDPIPHSSGFTASVYMPDNGLPDFARWTEQFKAELRQSYGLRGFEADLIGTVERREGDNIVLVAEGVRTEVDLVQLQENAKVQLDIGQNRPQSLTDEERGAFSKLKSQANPATGPRRIIGPIKQEGGRYTLQVRKLE